MTSTPQLDEPIDGRTARSVRTRAAIVDSTIALVEDGDLRPTAPRIAEGAGVSVRSIFQHFDDLETLFAAVGDRVVERLTDLIVPIDASRPVGERVAQFVEVRCRINEAITPIRRAALLQVSTSSVVAKQLRDGHDFFRFQLREVFAAELAAAGDHRRGLHDSLVVASSWSTWELLRTLERRSIDEAERRVGGLITWALSSPLASGDDPS